jgi:hypothetical protein
MPVTWCSFRKMKVLLKRIGIEIVLSLTPTGYIELTAFETVYSVCTSP